MRSQADRPDALVDRRPMWIVPYNRVRIKFERICSKGGHSNASPGVLFDFCLRMVRIEMPHPDGDELAQLPSHQLDVDGGLLHRFLARISDPTLVRRRIVIESLLPIARNRCTRGMRRAVPTKSFA